MIIHLTVSKAAVLAQLAEFNEVVAKDVGRIEKEMDALCNSVITDPYADAKKQLFEAELSSLRSNQEANLRQMQMVEGHDSDWINVDLERE